MSQEYALRQQILRSNAANAPTSIAIAPQGHHVQEPLVSLDGGSSHEATARSGPSGASSAYPQGLTSPQGQCVQEFVFVSSDGSSYTAPSVGLQSYVTAAWLAHGAEPYLLRFFAVAAPGRAP